MKDNQKRKVLTRREILRALTVTGSATFLLNVPNQWEKPTVEFGTLPALAQASPVFIAPTAPILSDISYELFSLNDIFLCGNGGSAFLIEFDYQDPNGDFDDSTVVQATAVFNPSGETVTTEIFPIIEGDNFGGRMTIGVCILFTTNTDVDVTVMVDDVNGLTSNALTVNIPKPIGANDTDVNSPEFMPMNNPG